MTGFRRPTDVSQDLAILSLILTVDASYGYRGEQSLLREYGSIAGGLGIRFRP